jgi:ATP phosphoribosyltransferase regulatory subunit
MSSLTKIPSGVQYFFDEEVRRRRHIERCALDVFAGWSYDEILLPMFDYHALFARGMGVERAERTYRFVDQDGALLALRPELTVLVARTVATRFPRKPRPLRLCYSGEVFRYDDPTERAAREFHQLGVELIGEPSLAADLEVLLIAVEILTTLGLSDYQVTFSHADFFNGVAQQLGLAGADRALLRELIDQRNLEALEAFLTRQAPHFAEARRREFCQLTQLAGGAAMLRRAASLPLDTQPQAAIAHLAAIEETVESLGLGDHFTVDLGEVANLDYYTGLTFRIYVPEWGVEIGSGGRYDQLISNFGRGEGAVGFSLSLDGLSGALAHSDREAPWREAAPPTPIAGGEEPGALAISFGRARKLRQEKKRVTIGANETR